MIPSYMLQDLLRMYGRGCVSCMIGACRRALDPHSPEKLAALKDLMATGEYNLDEAD